MFENAKRLIEEKIKELQLPYFSILVKKNGKEIFSYRFSNEIDNDLLCMYSVSKPLTTIALLKLVEQGKIKPSDPVSKYLDGYENLTLKDSQKEVNIPITIHHLLSMTSGLDYDLYRDAVKELIKREPNADTIKICSMFAKDGLCAMPGERFIYSSSMDVCAAIIEKVSGIRFSKYVEENIFKPVHANNSTFQYRPDLMSKCLKEYGIETGIPKISEPYYNGFFPTKNYESGGAGLISTIIDYSAVIDSIANCENLIIKDKTVDLMGSVYAEDISFTGNVEKYSKSSPEYGYGYGVRVRIRETKEHMPAGEFEWDGATGSYCLCDRKNHISIVMGMTIQNWPAYIKDLHLKIVKEIYKEIG